MSAPRDPWLAANLSWSFAGLGQLYAGRRRAGLILLGLEIVSWLVWVLWAVSAFISTGVLIGAAAFMGVVWILSSFLAFRAVRGDEPIADDAPKNPWKSLFFTRIILGSGHFYGGRWVRGSLLLAALLSYSLYSPPENWIVGVTSGYALLRTVGLLDSFLILRRQNLAPFKLSLAALLLVLAGSQFFLVALLARAYVVEVFRIPSSAMEPTLLGRISESHSKSGCPFAFEHQSPEGDRILVSKLAYAIRPIRRFDVAVFRFPLNHSKSFVKRVVGLPDEELQIHHGDIYVRSKGEERFRIARKPLDLQDRLWIRSHEGTDDTASLSVLERYWKLDGGDFSAGPEGGILWPTQRRMASIELRDSLDGRDMNVSFELRAPGEQDEVHVRIDGGHGNFELNLYPLSKGELRLRRSGDTVAKIPLETLPRNQWCSIDLSLVDGQAVVRRDLKVIGQFNFIEFLEDDKGGSEGASSLSLRARGSGLSIRALQVGRDIHYRGRESRERGMREDTPIAIPPGHYLTFGDNVANSHDSRAWVKRTFVLKDGRKIICESQQVMDRDSSYTRRLQEKFKLPEAPLYAIDGDQDGNEVAISEAQFDHEDPAEAFRFVEQKFFVGRVLKIWWPLGRERPVR
jgi:signal peptidase I